MAINERQKPFSKIGYLNAEIVTTPNYHEDWYDKELCHCVRCEKKRNELKRRVNKLVGRKFYEDV